MLMLKRLNSIHIFIVTLCAVLLLSGCVTHETYIKSEELYAQKLPVENKPTFLIFGEKLVLNDYSLRYKRNTPGDVSYSILIYSRNISGRRYDFYKNGSKLYTVDIIASDKQLDVGNVIGFDVSVQYNIEMTIVIHNNDSYKEEFKINFDEQKPYVLFNDRNMGEIAFDYYKARNKNTPQSTYELFDGFKISANNEEYGIHAFHPSLLYLKNNVKINDRMALYILATYASILHNEYKKSLT